MVARVEAYLNARRKLGFQLRIEGGELLRFARYADSSGHRGALTTAEQPRRCRPPRSILRPALGGTFAGRGPRSDPVNQDS